MRRNTRRKAILVAAVAALALGATACGCLWGREEHAPSRFCAQSNTSVVEHCVDASEGPGSAWSKAEADGELPIQIWALEPSGAMLDDLAANEAALRAWFDLIDRAVAYVRDEEKNAESLRATLHGRLLGLLSQSRQRQEAILEEEPVRAADNFQQAMTDKASVEKEPLVAALAADKQAMAVVQAIFDQARSDAAPLQSRYAGVAASFAAYRATEAAETAAYAALSKQASRSGIDELDGAEQAVLAAAREASRAPNELAAEIMTLSAELQALAVSFEEAIAPHEEVLATHGAVVPDMTSGALRSLSAMLGYAQRRVARSDATATALLGGIALRRQSLRVLEGDEGAHEAIARSRLERASEVFGEGARARVEALSAAPPVSEKVGLPLLAERCGELVALVQMRPLCEAAGSSWREAGCAALRGRFDAAEAELRTGLPRKIAAGLAALREKGMTTAALDAAQARLDAGDVKGAAIAYDAAVRGAEGT
ncbi:MULTISPECIES: hypothetical protein [Sorangium]|uniref:Secreted protein n=1 Tax=Sorangium cellulosum TaxID=56 RepID=A0A4V0NI06_SORCE|nr:MULTISPECIES: hypothetical protein [Sorangium]AUX38502.1 hypothetical protein SOCE836_107460 [Sorangium cellulosum]WCQ97788.1 hypothetical protein NQZ70_10586 [Sorangium sp. Soce836]